MKKILSRIFTLLFFVSSTRGISQKQQLSNPSVSFTENKGQVSDQNNKPRADVLFGAMAGPMAVHLKKTGVSYQLYRIDEWREAEFAQKRKLKEISRQSIYRIDLDWVNANKDFTYKVDEALPGYTNYYLTNLSDGAMQVKSYRGVTFANLYNGIDVHYYEKDGQLKYDYIVAPQANYKQIRVMINGAVVRLNKDGSLLLVTPLGNVEEGAPLVYQNGRQLEASWTIKGNVLGFDIKNYDSRYELVIDPVTRLWGTYYGGSGADIISECTTDASGNLYVTGNTISSSGTVIATTGSYQQTQNAYNDAFLAKFDPSGIRLWATYYGNIGDERGESCTTDAAGNVYMAGWANGGADFGLATAGSHQLGYAGGTTDGFLVKFNALGLRQWATYYGDTEMDFIFSCATDPVGNVYIAGASTFTNFNTGTVIATPGSHQPISGGALEDAFLVKFNSAGVRQWGTYYGALSEDRAYSCATDASGNVYMTGYTRIGTSAIASPMAHQQTYGGGIYDAFIVKFNSLGIRQWGSYYGGSDDDIGNSCSADASGNVYISGTTGSVTTTSVATAGSHQMSCGGGTYDGFVAKFDINGARQWGSYYGGSGNDQINACKTDALGNLYIFGETNSGSGTVIATAGSFSYQPVIGSLNTDAFFVKFDGSGNRLWGSYYGGFSPDLAYTGTTDGFGNIYMGGYTSTIVNSIIATPGSLQPSPSSSPSLGDGFIVKLTDCDILLPTAAVNGPICEGFSLNFTASVSGTLVPAYSWLGPDSFTSAVQNPLITNANASSAGIYTLEVNNNGCKERTTIASSVNPTPTISVNSGSICMGSSFTLVPTGASTYTIQGGLTVVNPLSNSSYTIIGTSAFGCVASNTAVSTVTVNAVPTVSVNSGVICSGQSFTLVPSGANTYSYSSGSAIVAPITNSTVQIVGVSAQGCVSSNTAVSSITVNTTPTVSVNNGSICVGQSFIIVPSGADSYSISGGTFTVSPSTSTAYTITGTSSLGCISSNVISSLLVNVIPTVQVNSGAICSGQSFTLIPSGASTYTYSSGAAVISPLTNTTVNVTGTSSAGCVASNAATSSITVNITPTITVNSGSICFGESFTISPSGAASYTISGGAYVVAPLTNTIYNVTGTSSLGCVGTNVSSVTVNAVPAITVNNGSICVGESFTISPSGASTYTISGGSAIITPATTTSYTVSGSSSQGCISSNAVVGTVTVNALPIVTALGNVNTICMGEEVILNAGGASTYTWNTLDNTAIIHVSPSITTVYYVTGTDDKGCSAIASVSLNVTTCTDIRSYENQSQISVFPNPNNGSFTIFSSSNIELSVINELGQIIQQLSLNTFNNYSAELKQFAKGIYFLIGIKNSELAKLKIIVRD